MAHPVTPPALPTITVIVPTLNEAGLIRSAIGPALAVEDVEVIVADGGSVDSTVEVAKNCGASVVLSRPGRAHQMNTAAAIANGSILLFLHADTQLPERFDATVRKLLDEPGVVAGAFRLSIDGEHLALRLTETLANIRSRLLQLPYGDQAIFMKADTFRKLGGFPDLPVMEDYELVRRLRRRGRVGISDKAVKTSARRWLTRGVWLTSFTHQMMIAGYHLGLSPHRIAAWRRPG